MATTTNYGWDTPDDTDLVKDGAAAIRTLGSSIDTTTKNLNPQTTTGALAYRSATANVNTALPIGTAGQILAVSGGVPAWINNDQGDITEVQAGVGISVASGTGPIPIITNSSTDLITTAGDLLYGTAADTVARLGIGTAGQVLKVNSGATAPEWGSAAAGANYTLANSGGTSLTGAQTVTVSGLSNVDKIFIDVYAGSSASSDSEYFIRLNTDTGANYLYYGFINSWSNTYQFTNDTGTGLLFGKGSSNASSNVFGWAKFEGCNSSGYKVYMGGSYATPGGGGIAPMGAILGGFWKGSGTVTSVSIYSATGNWDSGTVYVYTSA